VAKFATCKLFTKQVSLGAGFLGEITDPSIRQRVDIWPLVNAKGTVISAVSLIAQALSLKM
jgi:hypothetical protein